MLEKSECKKIDSLKSIYRSYSLLLSEEMKNCLKTDNCTLLGKSQSAGSGKTKIRFYHAITVRPGKTPLDMYQKGSLCHLRYFPTLEIVLCVNVEWI